MCTGYRCPPLSPSSLLVTKHCFWHLSYPDRFHKSSRTGKLTKSESLLLPLFSSYESWSEQSNLSSGLGLDLDLPLFPESSWFQHRPPDCFPFESNISYEQSAKIGFERKRPGRDLWGRQVWGWVGWGHFNDEILAVSILEYFAHYLPNTLLMKYWQAAFIFSLW